MQGKQQYEKAIQKNKINEVLRKSQGSRILYVQNVVFSYRWMGAVWTAVDQKVNLTPNRVGA